MKQSGIQAVAQSQAEQAAEGEALGGVGSLDRQADDSAWQCQLGCSLMPGKTARPGERRVGCTTAMADQPVHVVGGKVEAGKSFYCRPDQDVLRTQGIGALLEQKTQEPIGQPDGREQVERIARALGGVRDDDPFGPFGPRHRHRDIRREASIGEDAAVQ